MNNIFGARYNMNVINKDFISSKTNQRVDIFWDKYILICNCSNNITLITFHSNVNAKNGVFRWNHRFLFYCQKLLTHFDSCDIIINSVYAAVAELADAPDLGSGGKPWGFKSLQPHHRQKAYRISTVSFFRACYCQADTSS